MTEKAENRARFPYNVLLSCVSTRDIRLLHMNLKGYDENILKVNPY